MNLHELDRLFSLYIRLSNSVDGMCICCYCGLPVKVSESECCHFVKRGHMMMRYNEVNCNPGHKECNQNDDKVLYAEFLEAKYGPGTAEKLRIEGLKIRKFGRYELVELQKKLRKEVERLKNE